MDFSHIDPGSGPPGSEIEGPFGPPGPPASLGPPGPPGFPVRDDLGVHRPPPPPINGNHQSFGTFNVNYPIGVQAALFILLLAPLLLLRKRERPRRQFSIWICDIIKIVAAYSCSEVVILLVKFGGLQFVSWEKLYQEAISAQRLSVEPINPRQVPNIVFERDAAGPQFRDFRAFSQFVSHATLVSNLVEVLPGLVVLYYTYKTLLGVGHRLVRSGKLSKVVARLLKCTGRDERNGYGFHSGNYGYPIRIPWLAVQTLLLSICILVVRLAIDLIFLLRPNWLIAACGCVAVIVPELPWRFMTISSQRLVVSYLVFAMQFLALDYLLKYRPRKRGQGGGYESGLCIDDQLQEWMENDSFESIPMEELTLEVPRTVCSVGEFEQSSVPEAEPPSFLLHTVRTENIDSSSFFPAQNLPRIEVPDVSSRSLDSPSPQQYCQHVSTARDSFDEIYDSPSSSCDVPTLTNDSDSVCSTPSRSPDNMNPIDCPFSSMPLDISDTLHSTASPNATPTDTTLPLRYGLVTAGLLNAANVGITLRNRSFLFGGSGTLQESTENEDTIEEEGLPSYDDSQRQQEALLRDTSKLIQRDALISELKRN